MTRGDSENHATPTTAINQEKKTIEIPVSEQDFLEQDPALRGQNYACLSFISPEDALKRKEAFFTERFLEALSRDLNEMMEGLAIRYPNERDVLRSVQDRYTSFYDPTTINDEYAYFVGSRGSELDAEFHTANNFQTSIRGIKVRGVFETLKEAEIRAQVLKRKDGRFSVYVAEVGCWCPWSPSPDEVPNQEYAETQLNTMMKEYKDNQSKRDEFFEQRRKELVVFNAADPAPASAVVEEATQ